MSKSHLTHSQLKGLLHHSYVTIYIIKKNTKKKIFIIYIN